jgi:CMP-N,N'-diacetyllegionaminic acid synthase
MFKDLKFLAVIPARGGSKGIPKKNIIELNGKPLIQYTIESAIQSSYLDDVIVTTDCEEIAEVSKLAGAEVPFMRPDELASDSAKTIDALVHAVDELAKNGRTYDYIVLLQPTQPLRLSQHIDEAIEKLIASDKSSLAAVTKVQEHPILVRSIDAQGELVPLLNVSSTVRRQDFPEFYKVNGAIYINKLSEFNLDTSLNDNLVPYIMDHRYSTDIDELFDLEIAKIFLANKED